MEHEKSNLAANLTTLRKSRKLTQIELAEILHYSDKSISKWENGDALPDLDTLIAICDYFEVTLDTFCRTLITPEQAKHEQDNMLKRRRTFTQNKITITLLSVLLVWFIATFAFVEVWFVEHTFYWMLFIWAIPVSSLLLVIFSSLWGSKKLILMAVSALIWDTLFAIHINFIPLEKNFWLIYFIGIPAQAAIILWSKLDFKHGRAN